jgi:hypothetical protein
MITLKELLENLGNKNRDRVKSGPQETSINEDEITSLISAASYLLISRDLPDWHHKVLKSARDKLVDSMPLSKELKESIMDMDND